MTQIQFKLTFLVYCNTDPKRRVFSHDLLDHSLKKHSVRLMCSWHCAVFKEYGQIPDPAAYRRGRMTGSLWWAWLPRTLFGDTHTEVRRCLLRGIAWHSHHSKIFVEFKEFTVWKGRELNATSNVMEKRCVINTHIVRIHEDTVA